MALRHESPARPTSHGYPYFENRRHTVAVTHTHSRAMATVGAGLEGLTRPTVVVNRWTGCPVDRPDCDLLLPSAEGDAVFPLDLGALARDPRLRVTTTDSVTNLRGGQSRQVKIAWPLGFCDMLTEAAGDVEFPPWLTGLAGLVRHVDAVQRDIADPESAIRRAFEQAALEKLRSVAAEAVRLRDELAGERTESGRRPARLERARLHADAAAEALRRSEAAIESAIERERDRWYPSDPSRWLHPAIDTSPDGTVEHMSVLFDGRRLRDTKTFRVAVVAQLDRYRPAMKYRVEVVTSVGEAW